MEIAKDTVHHSRLANSHPEMHQYDHPHIIMVTMVTDRVYDYNNVGKKSNLALEAWSGLVWETLSPIS